MFYIHEDIICRLRLYRPPATNDNCDTPQGRATFEKPALEAGFLRSTAIDNIPARSPRTLIFSSPSSGTRMIASIRERMTSGRFDAIKGAAFGRACLIIDFLARQPAPAIKARG